MFPVDLFRFTADAWRYTFSWIHYCVLGNSKDVPCLFCRGLDLGEVPRRVSFRIHYQNLWLVRLLQPDLATQKAEDRLRPRMACMREGGYIRLPWYVPVLALVLGAGWNAALFAGIWYSGVMPEAVREQVMALFR